jgi:PAS domain-containing protein
MSVIRGKSLESSGQSAANLEVLGRYAALAFCRADVLIQITDDLTIKFCSGPTHTFLGPRDRELKGRPLLDIIHNEDWQLILDAVSPQNAGSRIDDLLVRLQCDDGPVTKVAVSGYRVPDFDNDFFSPLRHLQKSKKFTSILRHATQVQAS